jgi:endo-1,4-beta-mannosidase
VTTRFQAGRLPIMEHIVSEFKTTKPFWAGQKQNNLDFENRNKENVLNWLDHMITVIKENDPNHLNTVGWSN